MELWTSPLRGPARALRAVWTARGQRWRVAHRLPTLSRLSPTIPQDQRQIIQENNRTTLVLQNRTVLFVANRIRGGGFEAAGVTRRYGGSRPGIKARLCRGVRHRGAWAAPGRTGGTANAALNTLAVSAGNFSAGTAKGRGHAGRLLLHPRRHANAFRDRGVGVCEPSTEPDVPSRCRGSPIAAPRIPEPIRLARDSPGLNPPIHAYPAWNRHRRHIYGRRVA